ncbi:hypothetical protein ACIGH6_05760 [Brachybacterium paraconglomeratum]|uniref:hypothetical protein n=1 Tax=Brachybacterium paraconglomeratum TaxID=173362 RepID=UPI0037C70B23
MISRAHVRSAASDLVNDRARNLGDHYVASALTRKAATAKILAAAVDSGVVAHMCRRHHQRLAEVWGRDEVTSAITSMLVQYALGDAGSDGHLDPVRFADGSASAAGWVGKVIGSMRTTRILREMSIETRELAVPLALERAVVASAEDAVLAASIPAVEASTRGLPATSATIRVVHASALHQLLGLPALRPWDMTRVQSVQLRQVLEHYPEEFRRVLAGDVAGVDPPVGESIRALWAGWDRDDVSEMLALSTPDRDIPRVLASAALRPLPRPTIHSRALERLRVRARDGVPESAGAALSEAFEAFLDSRVELHTDFDRIRRRPTGAETARRAESRDRLPVLLHEAAQPLGISDLDLLSGLIAMFIDPLPVADPVYFTPTSWRFPE